MTEELPNFAAVTLEEAIEWADPQIEPRRPLLSEWVATTNAERAQAQIDYKAQPIEVAGVTLRPGDCANLSLKDRWSETAKRKLNCVIVGQAVSRSWGSQSSRIIRFNQYGAKADPSGYNRPKPHSISFTSIVGAEKVDKPDWIVKYEAERKERGY